MKHSNPPKSNSVRIGKRYRANRVDSHYDVIVIGSGIGGLTTACCLAKAGRKVLVLEQHYTVGGYTHCFERHGYEWDVGLHYIGDMGRDTAGKRLFDYLSDGQLQWAEMNNCYDRIVIGDKSFDLVTGKISFINELIKYFPDESPAIKKYMDLLFKVEGNMQLFFSDRLVPKWLASLIKPWSKLRLPSFFKKTTYEVLKGITKNEELIAVLCGQWGDCGLPPKQSSFLIHAVIAKHYLNGGFYPVGGASSIGKFIDSVIQKNGSEVCTYAQVDEILFDGKRAVGVLLKDGNSIAADVVVSNAGVKNTFEKLVPERIAKQAGYFGVRDKLKPSIGHLCLYIGLQESAEQLGLPKTNYWIYPSQDYEGDLNAYQQDDQAPFPVAYISFPSAKDPSFQQRYPGKATIEIITPALYEWFEPWKELPWGKRGTEYQEKKEAYSQRLLAILYQHFPQLEGKIDYYELSTPLSTEYFSGYSRGELYGLDHTPLRFQQSWLQPKTNLNGLYLTGQDILTCGVLGAAMGGLFCAVSILGMQGLSLMKTIYGK